LPCQPRRQQEEIEDKNAKNQKIIYHLESEDNVSQGAVREQQQTSVTMSDAGGHLSGAQVGD
jgi:hypothetical protein